MKLTDLQINALRCLNVTSQGRAASTRQVNLFLTDPYAPSALPQLLALERKGYVKLFEEEGRKRPVRYWEMTDAGRDALQ